MRELTRMVALERQLCVLDELSSDWIVSGCDVMQVGIQ